MTTSATAQQTANGVAGDAAAAVCNGNVNAMQINQQQATAHTATTTTVAPLHPTASGQHQQPRAMQSDEDFNIRFVNLVRIHKCLYDKKVPEYRNRDNQEKAWSLISQETRESVIHCKERWRNLRACLSRYIKQQSSADPQHKPYYLTEHMAFLLPFLKSTRNSIDHGHGMATLFQVTQPHHHHHHTISPNATIQVLQPSHLHYPTGSPDHMALKHSLSEQEDEETMDACDPAVAQFAVNHNNNNQSQPNHNGLGLMPHHLNHHHHLKRQPPHGHSPPLSDTASANTLQNFIPDVQLSELRTPEPHSPTTHYTSESNGLRRDSSSSSAKRIKTECHSQRDSQTPAHMSAMYAVENSDMEFFRSIMPDIAALTPQQKRKLKIGILELIDDVVDRYPVERLTPTANGGGSVTANGASQRRTLSREWRK